MPIKHAALKQLRKDRGRQERNQAVRSELKTLTKRLSVLLREQKREEAAGLIRLLAKKFDLAASKGILHANTAARSKSRLARHFNASPSK